MSYKTYQENPKQALAQTTRAAHLTTPPQSPNRVHYHSQAGRSGIHGPRTGGSNLSLSVETHQGNSKLTNCTTPGNTKKRVRWATPLETVRKFVPDPDTAQSAKKTTQGSQEDEESKSQASTQRSSPRKSTQAANTSLKLEPSTAPLTATNSVQTPPKKAYRPHVPDPPTSPRPSPTPRINRLPTPDIPDLDDRPFCGCGNPYCSGKHYYPMLPGPVPGAYNKMDYQMSDALEYMKSRR